jgi:hypothetical protein
MTATRVLTVPDDGPVVAMNRWDASCDETFGICKCWVVLSALDLLDAVTAVVCYCDKTPPPAPAFNFNLVHKSYD